SPHPNFEHGDSDMSEIGSLKVATPGKLTRLTGHIETLDRRLLIRLEGDESLCDAQSPSHRVYARSRMGTDVQVGSAWLKTAKSGPRSGERFLSISIDYPGLSAPLNVAAFPDANGDEWIVAWRRRGAHASTALAP